jgi:hypothetical protein
MTDWQDLVLLPYPPNNLWPSHTGPKTMHFIGTAERDILDTTVPSLMCIHTRRAPATLQALKVPGLSIENEIKSLGGTIVPSISASVSLLPNNACKAQHKSEMAVNRSSWNKLGSTHSIKTRGSRKPSSNFYENLTPASVKEHVVSNAKTSKVL